MAHSYIDGAMRLKSVMEDYQKVLDSASEPIKWTSDTTLFTCAFYENDGKLKIWRGEDRSTAAWEDAGWLEIKE